MNVQYLSKAMLDYSETSENVYLTFSQHIELKNKKFEILVHLTFKHWHSYFRFSGLSIIRTIQPSPHESW